VVTDYFPNSYGLKTDIKVLKNLQMVTPQTGEIHYLELWEHFKKLAVPVHPHQVRCSAILLLKLIGKTKVPGAARQKLKGKDGSRWYWWQPQHATIASAEGTPGWISKWFIKMKNPPPISKGQPF
jgi:hypothetical protein